MNTKKLHDWWTAEVKWLSILMRSRVERRTLVKLTAVWALCALLLVLGALGHGDWDAVKTVAVLATGALAYSAAIDLVETERED